jgi:hypothetical protein
MPKETLISRGFVASLKPALLALPTYIGFARNVYKNVTPAACEEPVLNTRYSQAVPVAAASSANTRAEGFE